jgi:hypothetical protein
MSLVQNPDGQIAYLEKTEPEDSVRVVIEETYNVEELEKYANFIKFICLVDVFISAINIGSKYPFGVGICLFGLCGYQGAVTFNKTYIKIYSILQCIKIISKIAILFYVSTTISVIKYIYVLSIIFDVYILQQCKAFIVLLQ